MNGHRGTLTIAVLVLALYAGATSAQQGAAAPPQGGSSGTPSATSAQTATAPVGQTPAGSAATPSAPPAAQQPATAPADKSAPEISSQQSTDATFKVKVNLVEVRAVVLDAQGHAVGNLKQDDFQLFDNGKPQVISRFSVEKAGTKPVARVDTSPDIADEKHAGAAPTMVMPQRYIAYLFDDVHLKIEDLGPTRDAAKHNLQTLQPTDRAGIFTTSGQNQVDFTDDRNQLNEALGRLRPRSITVSGAQQCPDVSYYMADQIRNKHDDQALRIVTQDALNCAFGGDSSQIRVAQQMALSAAMSEVDLGNHETQVSLASLKAVVRKIASMPGQRSILLISPGFINPDQIQEQMDIADRALHSGVMISALDARGLYTGMPDASSPRSPSSSVAGPALQYMQAEAAADADVLAEFAYTTGGTFIRNSNDFEGGLRKLATPPEYSYLLAFAPQNLKYDGKFHKLKVTAKSPEKLNVQARKGYYAPKQAADATAQAEQQVRDEVFSQEEVHDIPLQMHTQFFKTGEDNAKLSVVIRLDVRHLHYRKAEGRNLNSLTVVSALFDRNGNYVSGNSQVLNMKWKDETLESKLGSGVTLKSNFDVKPGSYLVRLVVRDEDGQLAAQNGAVEIP